ncbi:nitrous oxide reductase family maturation protein NosD [Schinkia azotoformans MEV2011]|uniref:Nitrous oxide reductase family maturation protein NosD n=1 Tax=Schinkia azotoformans MEV2011 TaxID=1348973 RepID=A0A072NT12_SCHAZ|nr:nitrous oxide reductase family maturation protein NosD [Schinkia azotoformans]KEF40013.1 nitrous oxide reductase family maturation protein NosD [Schinkia azotoformans MEV2011]MEC1694709.1 nitrous oxide reductase family maturation protein NosD [Schinkia azotoformans]MEC1716929.1 nitrous oxide reductase family maturation protein NosD [Schinkia azotoformans]MEC1726392.1 nitrous oxide reductase family maturation protein NosD [Schinkia azotoformans]MEC1743211.1 nitrous oxide reductase family mat
MIRKNGTLITNFIKLNRSRVQINNKRLRISPLLVKIQAFVIVVFLGLLLGSNVGYAEESLQDLIDQTPENGTLQLEDKTYEGNIVISSPITIIGTKETVIKGEGKGNVITVKASNVTLKNFSVINSGHDRNSGEEYAGIKLMKDGNIVDQIKITDCFHGVYLSQSHHNKVSNVTVIGKENGEIGGQGNGIQLYYSHQNELVNNYIEGTRDGIFFDYSHENISKGNEIQHTRYGLHYMYSDRNKFTKNRFSYNIGGAAIMESRGTILENNQFILNQGTRSYGLLMQSTNDTVITKNLFFQNQRGIYFDQSQKAIVKDNEFLQNQIGVEVWASSADQVFSGNRFSNNIATVLTFGGKDNNQWSENGKGNYWGNSISVLDLDQNGIGDYPVEYKSSLYQLVEDNELAYLFLKSPAIKVYEKMNEVLNKKEVMVTDQFPLVEKGTINENNNLYIIILLLMVILGSVYWKRKRRRA